MLPAGGMLLVPNLARPSCEQFEIQFLAEDFGLPQNRELAYLGVDQLLDVFSKPDFRWSQDPGFFHGGF